MGTLRTLIEEMRISAIDDASAEQQLVAIGNHVNSVEKQLNSEGALASDLRDVLNAVSLTSLQLNQHISTQQLNPYLQGLDSSLQVVLRACGELANASATATTSGAGAAAPSASPPGCLRAEGDLAPWTSTEKALTTGRIGDQHAESDVLDIQQHLVDTEQRVGERSAFAARLQGVVDAMGNLGVALNKNASVRQIQPLLGQVDAAVAAVRKYCGG